MTDDAILRALRRIEDVLTALVADLQTLKGRVADLLADTDDIHRFLKPYGDGTPLHRHRRGGRR